MKEKTKEYIYAFCIMSMFVIVSFSLIRDEIISKYIDDQDHDCSPEIEDYFIINGFNASNSVNITNLHFSVYEWNLTGLTQNELLKIIEGEAEIELNFRQILLPGQKCNMSVDSYYKVIFDQEGYWDFSFSPSPGKNDLAIYPYPSKPIEMNVNYVNTTIYSLNNISCHYERYYAEIEILFNDQYFVSSHNTPEGPWRVFKVRIRLNQTLSHGDANERISYPLSISFLQTTIFNKTYEIGIIGMLTKKLVIGVSFDSRTINSIEFGYGFNDDFNDFSYFEGGYII